ncbi:MAG: glycosyltransferase family 2 protein [Chloroflexi bacterium]|nr:glycosyltransferase family 2 protein [Chloroflexota bacterium]
MRVGTNPIRSRYLAYSYQRVGVASITFAPFLEGFFSEAIEVIDIHLNSIRQSVSENIDLLVFDNGSCVELTDFLCAQQRLGLIDWLFLSKHNLGKAGALNWIFASMPNEYIVYTDSDVLFRPGWLEQSSEVFNTFERVGIVSAQTAFFDDIPGVAATAQRLAELPGVQLSEEMPNPEILSEFCEGVGAPAEVRQRLEQIPLHVATHRKKGVRAVAGTTHMQFMLQRELARRLSPLPVTRALDSSDDFEINRRVDAMGYLQLSLPVPLVYHMGNRLEGRYMLEANNIRRNAGRAFEPWDHARAQSRQKSRSKKVFGRSLQHSPRLKRLIQRVYAFLFDILYANYE